MLAGVLLLAVLLVWDYGLSSMPVRNGGGEVTVYIPPGTSLKGIQQVLVKAGMIGDDIRFQVLARLMGNTHRLRAGEYRIAKGATPFRILKILAAGKTVQREVTIPEGDNIFQIADILAAQKLAKRRPFLQLCRNRAFIRSLGLDGDSLEGYLFPDTYYFERGTPLKELVRVMVRRFDAVWKQLKSTAGPLTMTRHQIVTLASIVVKETADPAERPLIARVYLERLKRHMLLQADPTVFYGLRKFSGRLHSKDLKKDEPYNTYMHKGLPPGPIANPGRASLYSVLHPSDKVFLYFVSKNDGTHYFSKTLAEHNRAVQRFQKDEGGKRDAASGKPQAGG